MLKQVCILLLSILISCGASAGNNPYRSDVVWVAAPDSSNWQYDLNAPATVEVAVYHYGIRQSGLAINYRSGPDMLPATTHGVVTSNQNGMAVIDAGTRSEPGFKTLHLTATIDGKDYQHHLKLGFAPEQIMPVTTMPDDFTSFWQAQVEQAQQVPVVVERTWVAELSDHRIDRYLVKLQAYQPGQFVYGYLTIPKQPGRFPAVFSPPGAGIKPLTPDKHRFYGEQGMIRFDMEIHGIRPDLDRATYSEISQAFGQGNNSYLVNGLDSRDSYYMKKAYLSSLRVLDYLTSLPEWDGKNLIAQGGSQGGALALVTAALDKRVTAVAANHPALSDMGAYLHHQAGGYPHLFSRFTGMDTPAKLNTLRYYDVVNFARMITAPVFMTWGYNDNVCPPTTSYAVYNVISSDKQALITPVNEHWVSTNTRHKILNWIKTTLRPAD